MVSLKPVPSMRFVAGRLVLNCEEWSAMDTPVMGRSFPGVVEFRLWKVLAKRSPMVMRAGVSK